MRWKGPLRVSREEVVKAMGKNGKATGPSAVNVERITASVEIGIRGMIVRECWMEEECPRSGKSA